VNIVKQFDSAARSVAILAGIIFALPLACTPPPSVVTQSNQAPVIENMNYAKDAFANSDIQIGCVAKDANGDNLTYQWKAEAGQITGSGSNVLWMSPGKMGTYPITLVVTDGKGGVATENISIRVVTNADGTATPQVELKLKLGDAEPVIVDKQRVRIWMTTDIICIVDNATGAGDLTYTWSATAGKMQGKGFEEGMANRIRWTAPGVKSDVAISVIVKDSQGREARGRVNIDVFCCGN